MKQTLKLWMLAAILTCGASVFTSCSSDNDDNPVVPTDEGEGLLRQMTLREKVGQLFYVRPECLDTTIHFNLPGNVDASSDDIKAITLQYTNAEAAVGTLQAGADIVLGPQNFVEAFDAVVKAVEDGVLTEQRIDQSVRRILRLKQLSGR